ncbi:MAG: DUF397 domain-containing protein [Actinomycetes bacterium]
MSGSESGHEFSFVGSDFCNSVDCVEAARLPDGRVALRSNLAVESPPLVVTAAEWARFLDSVKGGHFDVV